MARTPESIADDDLTLLCAAASSVAGFTAGAIERGLGAESKAAVVTETRAAAPAEQTGIDATASAAGSVMPPTTMGVGPVLVGRLLECFGSATAIVRAAPRELAQVDGIGAIRARRLHEALRKGLAIGVAQRERQAMRRCGASLIMAGDDDYPPLLATICDPPLALWLRGDIREQDRLAVAIVGARRCGAYGIAHAARISGALSERGWTIISGGARGIDAEAHRAALRAGGRTIAVFGNGLGRCYPPEHGELFERIAEQGALLSEMPCETPPRAEFFPRRNRIVSGLSLGVVVIEAAARSGALITARLAVEEHHREVMALPGSVDSPRSAGCHRAIREGWAALVTNADEVVEQLQGARTLLEAIGESTTGGRAEVWPEQAGRERRADPAGIRRGAVTVSDRPPPSEIELSAMTTVDAVLALARSTPRGCSVAAIADRLDRPVAEIMTAATILCVDGQLACDAGNLVAPPSSARR